MGELAGYLTTSLVVAVLLYVGYRIQLHEAAALKRANDRYYDSTLRSLEQPKVKPRWHHRIKPTRLRHVLKRARK